MNVAEWAKLHGDHVGCSVIHVDEGIDTGDVVAAERR
jgi:methionyl-tRNA formyltransferase